MIRLPTFTSLVGQPVDVAERLAGAQSLTLRVGQEDGEIVSLRPWREGEVIVAVENGVVARIIAPK